MRITRNNDVAKPPKTQRAGPKANQLWDRLSFSSIQDLSSLLSSALAIASAALNASVGVRVQERVRY